MLSVQLPFGYYSVVGVPSILCTLQRTMCMYIDKSNYCFWRVGNRLTCRGRRRNLFIMAALRYVLRNFHLPVFCLANFSTQSLHRSRFVYENKILSNHLWDIVTRKQREITRRGEQWRRRWNRPRIYAFYSILLILCFGPGWPMRMNHVKSTR